MKRPVLRRSEETKEKILLAALKLMARSGYHGAKTKAIAMEAGVNEALIFRYFGSKKDLLKALIEKNRLAETIAPFDKPKEYSLVSFLQTAARSAFDAYEKNPDFFRLLRFTLLEEPDLLRDYRAYHVKNRSEPLVRFLARARQQGLVRGDLAVELQAQIFGGLLYYMLEQRSLGINPLVSKLSVKASVDLIVDHFLQGSNPLAFRPSTR
ncbi:MAG: TetR/AcrR family transcriptional regulator [Nitrospirae bacterium]|nr:TetR/AcrR family transcriptional regulator [Nitrospirota bacterium]